MHKITETTYSHTKKLVHKHYSYLPKDGNNANIYHLMNGYTIWNSHTIDELSSHEKMNAALIDATLWMNLESIMLSQRSQTQKAIYCIITFT